MKRPKRLRYKVKTLEFDPSEMAIIRLALQDRIVRYGTDPAGLAAQRVLDRLLEQT